MTRLLRAAALAVFVGGIGQAQSTLTGKWQGTTPNGARLMLDLTATDGALTGTLTRNDQTYKIVDGKTDGKTFSFKATMEDRPEAFSGELAGSEIRVWLDRRGPESAITLTRVEK